MVDGSVSLLAPCERAVASQDDTAALRSLGLAIIYQALTDFFDASDRELGGVGKTGKVHMLAAIRARREAELFLFATTGPWARSRANICDIADVHEGDVRLEAWRRLEAATSPVASSELRHERHRKARRC